MKKFIFAVLFLMPIYSWAADDYVIVSPQKVSLNEFNKTGRLHVVNKSDAQKTYKIKLVNYEMQRDGTLAEVKNFKYSARNLIIYSPKKITLKGREDKYIDIEAIYPEDLARGEYHIHMALEEIGGEKEDNFLPYVPIFVKKGSVETEVKLGAGELDSKTSPSILSLTFLKSGNASLDSILTLYSVNGIESKLIGVPMRISLYSEVNKIEQKFNIPSDINKVKAVLTDMENNIINTLEIEK